ncbi:MAG: biosynthetic arginine decarboxylase, partial [Bdellovibrionales bacterium]|nr:biosynthetic arginine decarboxylase [Bdellovibrionales bacterium]
KNLCPSLCMFDVGGGLAVDYDGSRTNFESSMNYSLEEYARDVVSAIEVACSGAGHDHPTIISESGRALVAHHAVLVGEVIDVVPTHSVVPSLPQPPTDHPILKDFVDLYDKVSVKNCQETLHDAIGMRDEVFERFLQEDISLVERAFADDAFGHLIAKIRLVAQDLKFVPEDLQRIEERLRDTYFCNFSLFQSMPDSWAIDQLFPIMPLHRLSEEPVRRGVLADISCDSDGKVDRFVDLKDVNKYLLLHETKQEEPYYFGVFLVGAYQEILGDLHNLFGDTNAVHIDSNGTGGWRASHIVEGDTVREVLQYVQYDPEDLLERMRRSADDALESGVLTAREAAEIRKKFRSYLEEYTYLNLGNSPNRS